MKGEGGGVRVEEEINIEEKKTKKFENGKFGIEQEKPQIHTNTHNANKPG